MLATDTLYLPAYVSSLFGLIGVLSGVLATHVLNLRWHRYKEQKENLNSIRVVQCTLIYQLNFIRNLRKQQLDVYRESQWRHKEVFSIISGVPEFVVASDLNFLASTKMIDVISEVSRGNESFRMLLTCMKQRDQVIEKARDMAKPVGNGLAKFPEMIEYEMIAITDALYESAELAERYVLRAFGACGEAVNALFPKEKALKLTDVSEEA